MGGDPTATRSGCAIGLRLRGVLLLALAAASVGVPGYVLAFRSAEQRERQLLREGQPLALLTLTAGLASTIGSPPADSAWLGTLASGSAGVRYVGIFDGSPEALEFRQRFNVPRELLARYAAARDPGPRSRPFNLGGAGAEARLWTFPLDSGRGVMLAVVDAPPDDEPQAAVAAWIAAGAAGLIVSFVGFAVWVARPALHVQQRVADLRADLLELAPSDDAAALTWAERNLDEISREVKRYRAESRVLRHSLERRIDARTRSVADALRDAEQAADTDPLTGLCNRRALLRDLPDLFDLHAGRGLDLCVALIDVNNLKAVNDQFGHAAGDELIRTVAEVLRACIRRSDVAARHGGDEFVLVLPGVGLREARGMLERLGDLLRPRLKKWPSDPGPGIAAGLAGVREDGAETADQLLQWADQAMYLAKRNRRLVATVAELRSGKGAGNHF